MELSSSYNDRNLELFLTIFLNLNDPKTHYSTSELIVQLIKFDEYYREARFPSTKISERCGSHLINIHKLLKVAVAMPISISLIKLFNEQEITQEQLTDALKFLEIFVFRNLIIANRSFDDFTKLFQEVASAIVKAKSSLPLERLLNDSHISNKQFYKLFKTFKTEKSKIHKYIHFEIVKSQLTETGEILQRINLENVNLEHILPQNPDQE